MQLHFGRLNSAKDETGMEQIVVGFAARGTCDSGVEPYKKLSLLSQQ